LQSLLPHVPEHAIPLDDLEFNLRDTWYVGHSVQNQTRTYWHELAGVARQHDSNMGWKYLAKAVHRDDVNHGGFIHDKHAAACQVVRGALNA
jgi:hypothetical protein